ncbi:metallophosphoesterase family protein [Roseomonas marmotae]|uniref:DNA repair exonuclease n=1 Tax=Roseomonas marmotae TaxID=2768161 RepID=A0ABS3KHR7_9PROT|nr:DNA repair exonuclease [Roseomonas marmotae]MBO1075861.1 DNA repair exonuclease [Roseomonas marmotae]QTI81949.1 DNA repair exonuclease [Roseomonas marmotae]
MPSFRFLHAADLHLDSPLRGLDADASAPAQRIRQASRDALGNLVRLALAEQVDFLVVAGDLYDGDWQDFRTGQALVAAFARLTRAGIRIVAIRGNHDADSVLTRDLRLPEGATLLAHKAPQTLCFEELGVAFHGQSFAQRAVVENIARAYPRPHPGLFNIGLLHTAAAGHAAHENYAPCSIEQLAGHGYDYWALGHVHERAVLHREPWIVFPGNLQGRHVNEPGAKGASLVTVRGGRVADVSHQPLDTVRWDRLSIDCTGTADMPAVLDRVSAAMQRAMDRAEGRLLALRIQLEGPCPAHLALVRDAAATRETIRSAGLELSEDDLWIEDVRIRTRPALELSALRARTDAVGRLVGAIEDLAASPDEALAAPVRDYAARLLDRAGLREALGEDHPAVLAAGGTLPLELLERARALLLARLAED